MHVPSLALVSICALGFFTAGAASPVSFQLIDDSENDRIRSEVQCGDNQRCVVSRVMVQRPYYDGPPGYTAILVHTERSPSLGVWTEELAVFARGQYRLLGYDPENVRVLCFKAVQQGASEKIANLTVFDAGNPDGKIIGPQGAYQYVSCSSDGETCLLVDTAITLVDTTSGATRSISREDGIPESAADPPQRVDDGFLIGHGYNISGRFVRMSWTDNRSGTLTVRGADGELLMEIPVTWEADG